MKNTDSTDQQPEKGNRITHHALFPTGKSLIPFPERTSFIHISHNERGELILHAIEQQDAGDNRIYRKFFATRSVDRYLVDPKYIFIGASTDYTKSTVLVFLDKRPFDSSGQPIPFHVEPAFVQLDDGSIGKVNI